MTTSVDITILPCEVRQYIWSYCRKSSLKVLSVCCKQMYAEVKPLIWKRVEVSWESLEGITKDLIKKPHPNLRLISCLVLDSRSQSASSLRNLSWGYLTFGLGSFLERCERLKSLTITRFLSADGPRLVSTILPQLQNLEMTDITLRAGDLKPLFGLLQLKSLKLSYCSIQKSDWDVVWQLESLEHLTVTHCSTPASVDCVRLKNLLSLDFFEIVESRELYSCIAWESVKLESLDLGSSSIQDSDILSVSRLPRLKYISLYGADQVTDLGISYLTHISCLERLRISACYRLSPHCLVDVAKIQTLRRLDLDQFSEDDVDISCLSNLVNLHTLIVSEMVG